MYVCQTPCKAHNIDGFEELNKCDLRLPDHCSKISLIFEEIEWFLSLVFLLV